LTLRMKMRPQEFSRRLVIHSKVIDNLFEQWSIYVVDRHGNGGDDVARPRIGTISSATFFVDCD